MAQQEQDTFEIKASPATKEELSWIEHQRKENQEGPRRLEDTAKYLSGLASLSLTIMLGPYSEIFKTFKGSAGLKIGITCWLISILFTLAVVFPFRYHYVSNSDSSIRKMNKRIAKIKFGFLLTGVLFYIVGISFIAFIYLSLPS